MSSREIAELTGKRHDNVMADARKMLEELGEDVLKFQGIYLDAYNREKPCFNLPKDLTITLVAGYNVKMRHRITVRWLELEEPLNPVGFEWADALRLAAELEEHESKFGGTYLVPYNCELMSSREIAELLGKRHDNVKRTIETLVAKGVIESPQTEEVRTTTNVGIAYRIGKRDSYVIVAQLSPEFTARLVDRWQELEEQVAQKPALPQTQETINNSYKTMHSI